MQIVGRYKGSVDWIWVVTIAPSTVKSRWAVYSPHALTFDYPLPDLHPERMNIRRLADFNDYCLATAICAGKNGIQKYSTGTGKEDLASTTSSVKPSMDIVLQLMSAFNRIQIATPEPMTFMNFLFSQDVHLGAWELQNEQIEIISVNQALGGVDTIKGLHYINNKRQLQQNFFSSIRKSAGLKRMKTYEQVIAEYDMTWMYDASGKKIKDYRLITTSAEFDALMKELEEANPSICAVDTETTGTNFYRLLGVEDERSKIAGMSISWKLNQGVYLVFLSEPVVLPPLNTLNVEDTLARIIPFLNQRRVVTHNGLFDGKVFYSYGFRLHITDDTLIQAFDLDSTVSRGSKGLKTLTRKYYNHTTLELEDILGPNFDANLVPCIDPRLIELYACADTDYTLRLFFDQDAQMKRLHRQSYAMDCAIQNILIPAEYYGSHIDTDRLQLMSDANQEDIEIVEDLMRKYYMQYGPQIWAEFAVRTNFFEQLIDQGFSPKEAEDKAMAEEVTVEQLSIILNDPGFQDQMMQLLHKPKRKSSDPYVDLEFTGKDIERIMFDILKYPYLNINEDTKRIVCDDETLSFLERQKIEPGEDGEVLASDFLKEDIHTSVYLKGINAYQSDSILISKKEFDSCQYPFAYLLKVWRKLDKFRGSFYNKLLNENHNSWFFSDYSMTSAETTRVISPIQTLEGSLKQLITPYSDDYYMIVFDAAQIEFRVMIGLANQYWKAFASSDADPLQLGIADKQLDALIQRLNDPETDYHREGGAIFAGCTPEDMTKEQRSAVKAVHFSVPYGAGAHSIAKKKQDHAKSQEEYDKIFTDTQITLSNWQKKMFPLYFYLEHVRDVACTVCSDNDLPDLLKQPCINPETGLRYTNASGAPMAHRPYGVVKNPLGQTRYFDLSSQDPKKLASIRRQAGNFPIQSFARDIFFTAIIKLCNRLKKEGLWGGEPGTEKVFVHNFVHDEATLQVHKSIHPYQMYKYIWEECITQLTGYPFFYIGVSVVNNWYEGKNDKFEAPVRFLYEKAQEFSQHPELFSQDDMWKVNPRDYVLNDSTKYMAWRYSREVRLHQQDKQDPYLIDEFELTSIFKNYFLKSRIKLYTKPLVRKCPTNEKLSEDDTKIISLLAAYILMNDEDEFSQYKLFINGNEIPFSQAFEVARSDDSEILDLDVADDLDLDNFDFESDELLEDQNDREQDHAEFYTQTLDLNQVGNRNRVVHAARYDLTQAFTNSDKWYDQDEENKNFVYSFNEGEIVVRIDEVDNETQVKLGNYFKNFISSQGNKLILWKGGVFSDSGVKVSDEFSKEFVNTLIYNSIKKAEESGKTSRF